MTKQKKVSRLFAGKATAGAVSEEDTDGESDASEKEEQDEESETKPKSKVQLKDVNLEQHFEQERILEYQRQEIEAEIAARGSEGEYETERSEESEPESEEDEAPRRVMLKPTFVPKAQRNGQRVPPTIATSTTSGPEESSDLTLDEQQRRRLETRQLLEESIRLDMSNAMTAAQVDHNINDVDDTDNIDPEAEHAAWKLRELLRIKRDRDVIENRERERQELEDRRAMPEAIRMRDDLAHAQQQRDEKLAQKRAEREESGAANGETYHHRGGFFQDDPIHSRKLTGTIENTQSGAGHRGILKKTGLLEQDTSSRDALWQEPGAKRSNGTDYEQRKKQRT